MMAVSASIEVLCEILSATEELIILVLQIDGQASMIVVDMCGDERADE
jgi:hypothetical protein